MRRVTPTFSSQSQPASLITRALLALTVLGSLMFAQTFEALANAQSRVASFKLANGMQVVVIPDHRAPVVTHMVWYRVGASDEPKGVSGIAHFLEHLMFKSTEKIAVGEFSKIVARMGGNDNAFTSHDATAYFQRIAKDRLSQVMSMEADRMINLRLDEKEVLTERDVILEERRSRVENSPGAILDEQMMAALYQNHPYGIPVIGWMHEIAKLSREDALRFYKQHYAPNNAILVVSGDVTADEVRRLADQHFGSIKPSEVIADRRRPTEPDHRAARRLEYKDARAGKPSFHRYYLAPSYATSKPGQAEALDILMKIIGDGATSRLYQRLVTEEKIATSASGYFSGSGLDSGRIGLSAVVAEGVPLSKVEESIDKVLAEVREKGITAEELERAKKAYIAAWIYQSDNQSSLARRYGWGLVTGQTVEAIDGWPAAIRNVTLEQVKAAADALNIQRSVTGHLLPAKPEEATAAPGKKG
jgi:zinc protease